MQGLARSLGIAKAGFYRNFKDRRELLDALLEYWEREMTDAAIDAAKRFTGWPEERVLSLRVAVTTGNLARYDLPIWPWAQSDTKARGVFNRTMEKRFEFAAWMFSEAVFSQ